MRIPLYLEVAQWALLFGLGALVVVLYRQLGRLLSHEPGRAQPGPAVGSRAAPIRYRRLPDGDAGQLTPGDGQPALIAFVDPTCPACEQLVSSLGALAAAGELAGIRVLLLISDPPGYLSISAAFQDTSLEIGRPLTRGGGGRIPGDQHAAAGRRRRQRASSAQPAWRARRDGGPGAGSIDRQGKRGRGMSWKQAGERFDTRVGDLAERVARRVSRRAALRGVVLGGTAGVASLAIGERPGPGRRLSLRADAPVQRLSRDRLPARPPPVQGLVHRRLLQLPGLPLRVAAGHVDRLHGHRQGLWVPRLLRLHRQVRLPRLVHVPEQLRVLSVPDRL